MKTPVCSPLCIGCLGQAARYANKETLTNFFACAGLGNPTLLLTWHLSGLSTTMELGVNFVSVPDQNWKTINNMQGKLNAEDTTIIDCLEKEQCPRQQSCTCVHMPLESLPLDGYVSTMWNSLPWEVILSPLSLPVLKVYKNKGRENTPPPQKKRLINTNKCLQEQDGLCLAPEF